MIEDKGILIQNIYYMLSYAFKELKSDGYSEISKEKFHNVHNLLAVILTKGVSKQIKRGLHKEYISVSENLSSLRGKINIYNSVKNIIQQQKKISCDYDELSINNIYNQIIKTAVVILLRHGNIDIKYHRALYNVMLHFNNVTELEISEIRWDMIKYHRNNATYEMLINVSYLILHDMLQSSREGNLKMLSFTDEIMHNLYERFIREYYRYHFKELKANSDVIEWCITDKEKTKGIYYLPKMNTDITLHGKNKTLIIDAKYYGKIMSNVYDKHIIHTNHLYQIYAYVKNMDKNNMGNVSGLMLYAKTQEEIIPNFDYVLSGSRISFKTLDLNCDFSEIRRQLDDIVKEYQLL